MACRFPGARSIEDYWANLCNGVESIRFLTNTDLDALDVDLTIRNDPRYVRAAAVLEGMDQFDAAFFGFSPREAEWMDPQHRVFLECCWEALEHAGYAPDSCQGSVGVYAGATTNTYLLYNLASNPELLSDTDHVQLDIANGIDFLSTRVAYKLGLRGPSYSVASACSTSLLAVHVAIQSLLNEECDMALAGGVSIHVEHPKGYLYVPGGITSPDGHCRAFDARANGTIFGSGAGVVVLKRLRDALDDGDHIHAIIKGSAANNDGAQKVGYTAPAVDGQAAVIREALAVAGVSPGTIGYVETHGTGTALGDPVEIRALTKAFLGRNQTPPNRNFPCLLGSVKTNIGHLGAAAGIASLIKTCLVLERGLVPPILHGHESNPEIDFVRGGFRVNTELTPWQNHGQLPRRAGVSSFGVGGTNVHVVLQEAPTVAPNKPTSRPELILLSAKSTQALESVIASLRQFFTENPNCNLVDVAYTLHAGRSAMPIRTAFVCKNVKDALDLLTSRDPKRWWSSATTMATNSISSLPDLGQRIRQLRVESGRHDECTEVLGALAALWVRGETIPHDALYGRENRRRIALPPYPFERRRHWIERRQIAPAQTSAAVKKANIDDWFYVPSWQHARLQRDTAKSPTEVQKGWLIFADRCDIATSLVERLSPAGKPITIVRRGSGFTRHNEHTYTLNPHCPEDYSALVQALRNDACCFDAVVHLWGVETGAVPLDDLLAFGFYSLTHFARAWASSDPEPKQSWWIIANGVCNVESRDSFFAEKATMLGPCIVIPQEFPGIRCRFIDVDNNALAAPRDIASELCAEFDAMHDEPIVALRKRRRWAQRFETMRLAFDPASATPLDPKGAYLLTRGLEGIGWEIAQYLANANRARLILLDDFDYLPLSSGNQATHQGAPTNDLQRKLEAVRSLERAGATVLVVKATTSNEEEMRRAFAIGIDQFEHLHGVIHTASEMRLGDSLPIRDSVVLDFQRYFDRQLLGLLTLQRTMPAERIDVCLVASSLSSVLGGIGQVANAAASQFVQAFVEREMESSKIRWICVDWDIWRLEGEVFQGSASASWSKTAILPAEGIEATRRILSMVGASRVLVSTTNLTERRQSVGMQASKPTTTRMYPRPAMPTPYVAPRNDIEKQMVTLWGEVLGIQEIGIDDHYFELGGDSLLAVQLAARIERSMRLQAPATMLFQRPTVRALVEALQQDGNEATNQRTEQLSKRRDEFAQRARMLPRRGR